jgi:hypothetical protein
MGDHGDMANTKKLIFAFVPLLLLAFLAAVAGEAFLRTRYEGTAAINGVTQWQAAEWGDLTYHWDIYHPVLGWTNLPGYEGTDDIPFEVTINSQGLRGTKEYAKQPPDGIQRILVFGDSTVFGEEVDDVETIPAYLETRMTAVEVLNLGVHGYGVGQTALHIERDGFAFEPDRVVVVYLSYGFLRDRLPNFFHAKPTFELQEGALLIANVPVPEFSREPWLVRHSYSAAWMWGWNNRRKPMLSRRLSDQLAVTSAILDRIQENCDQRGVPLTLVHISAWHTLSQIDTDAVERERLALIRKTLRERDVDFLDLFPFLHEQYKQFGSELVATHGHWNARGNQLIADRIAAHLAQLERTIESPATTRTRASGVGARIGKYQ